MRVKIGSMQRKNENSVKPFKTVSSAIPVLLKCAVGEENGMVGRDCVRIVTGAEVVDDNFKHRELSENQWNVLKGFGLLLLAHDKREVNIGAKLSETAAFTAYPGDFTETETEGIKPFLRALTVDDAFTAKQRLARQLAEMLGDAHLVFWTVGKKDQIQPQSRIAQIKPYVLSGPELEVKPGVLCDSFHTAAAFKMFFNSIRCCPSCLDLYVKVRPKQKACSTPCQDRHRQALWHDNQKELEKNPKSNKGRGGRK